MKFKNVTVEYHRNGISGEGFHTGFFDWFDDDNKWRKMFYVLYEGTGQCSIFDYELLKKGDVRFMHNSWRGDNFEKNLREAVEKA